MKKSISQQDLSKKKLVNLIDKRIRKALDKSNHEKKSCKLLKILLHISRHVICLIQIFYPFK